MRKINRLSQIPFRWFLLGFLLTPAFVLGGLTGNLLQGAYHQVGDAFKSNAQRYADQIMLGARLSKQNRSLPRNASLSVLSVGGGVKEVEVKESNEISGPIVNRLNKEDALSKKNALQSEVLVRRYPDIPLWKGGPRRATFKHLIVYSSLTDKPIYSFDDGIETGLEVRTRRFSQNIRQKANIEIPIPVRKNEFLQRSKRYYGANLAYKDRQKEHHCLAIGIYFEARGESKKGQIAVAQVIMNRVKESFYPSTICKVVWQGSHRRTGCQFSFTCDGMSDKPRSWRKWRLAKILARRVMDGKVWLNDIGNASHYHATYVNPVWKRDMWYRKKIGLHIFYRGKFLHKKRYRRRYHRRRNRET